MNGKTAINSGRDHKRLIGQKLVRAKAANKERSQFLILLATLGLTLSLLIVFGQKAEARTSIQKVSSEVASHYNFDTDAIETYRGQVISAESLKNNVKSSVEILNSHMIETTSGEIVYPEEVEYIHIKNNDVKRFPGPPNVRQLKRFPFNNDGGR